MKYESKVWARWCDPPINKKLMKVSGFPLEGCVGYKGVANESLATDAQGAKGNDTSIVNSMVRWHFQNNYSCFFASWHSFLTCMSSVIGCENVTLRSKYRSLAPANRFERIQNRKRLGTKRMRIRSVPERQA